MAIEIQILKKGRCVRVRQIQANSHIQMYVLKRAYYLGRPNNRVYNLVEAKGGSGQSRVTHSLLIDIADIG